jgi:hypothetical protein
MNSNPHPSAIVGVVDPSTSTAALVFSFLRVDPTTSEREVSEVRNEARPEPRRQGESLQPLAGLAKQASTSGFRAFPRQIGHGNARSLTAPGSTALMNQASSALNRSMQAAQSAPEHGSPSPQLSLPTKSNP